MSRIDTLRNNLIKRLDSRKQTEQKEIFNKKAKFAQSTANVNKSKF